jgi:hypothetical protein
MRGEEIVRIDIGVIRKHWKEALKHPEEPHTPLAMAGRFKRTVGEKVYIQPLALESASGLQYRLWMHRALQEYGKAGVTQGPMFRVEDKRKGGVGEGRKGFKRARVGDLDNVLRPLLMRVQEQYPDTKGGTSTWRRNTAPRVLSSEEPPAKREISRFRPM